MSASYVACTFAENRILSMLKIGVHQKLGHTWWEEAAVLTASAFCPKASGEDA